MSIKFKVGGVPEGTYVARLDSVEEKEGDFGLSVFYSFTVVGSAFDGQSIGRFTPMPAAGNKGAEFLRCVTGQVVSAGADIALDEYIGRRYSIIAKPTKSGSVRVEVAILLPESEGGA